jgi:hypothetical protein
MPSALRLIFEQVVRTEEDKDDLAETRRHIQHGWREAIPVGRPNELLARVVGNDILKERTKLLPPEGVEWRWPIAITAAALDFALTVPGMRLSVCGDTLVHVQGTCEDPQPRAKARGGEWAPLDERGRGELHDARARVSLCMRHKDFAELAIGLACAMTPLLKRDYRPSPEPTVTDVEGELRYTLSQRSGLTWEDENDKRRRITTAALVDGLEEAAKSKRAAEEKRRSARPEAKREGGGCAIL